MRNLTSTHTIVSTFEPDKKPNGKDGPTGTDKVTETITTTNTYNVTISNSETNETFNGTEVDNVVTITTALVNSEGEVNDIEQNTSSFSNTTGVGPFTVYCKSTANETTKSLSESDLGYAHGSAVNYVKDTRKNTGYSPSQLNAQKEQKGMSILSLASGGIGTSDALTGGKILGATASKAFGLASLFLTLCDLASDYSGRSNPINCRTIPKKK